MRQTALTVVLLLPLLVAMLINRPSLLPHASGTSAGSELWAFVSITNNETQHLTLVTPQ